MTFVLILRKLVVCPYVLCAYCVLESTEETEIRRRRDRQEEKRTEENDGKHQINVKDKRKK
jgi:hypothetical protein